MNKKIFFSSIVFLFSLVSYPQFGTIGYDFKDPYIGFEGLQFAVRLSTEQLLGFQSNLQTVTNVCVADEGTQASSRGGWVALGQQIHAASGGWVAYGRITLVQHRTVDGLPDFYPARNAQRHQVAEPFWELDSDNLAIVRNRP